MQCCRRQRRLLGTSRNRDFARKRAQHGRRNGRRLVDGPPVGVLAGADRRLGPVLPGRPRQSPADLPQPRDRARHHASGHALPGGALGRHAFGLHLARLRQSADPARHRADRRAVGRCCGHHRRHRLRLSPGLRLGDALLGTGRGRGGAVDPLHVDAGRLEPLLLLDPCRDGRAGRASACGARRGRGFAYRARGAAPAARSAFPVQRAERRGRGNPRASDRSARHAARSHAPTCATRSTASTRRS